MPFYHIVIADGRAPREGRFIEKIGTYNPLTKPAEILLDFDKALDWLQKGASPSDTVKAILAYKGILFKNHLLKGVTKGAMTAEQAEAKFQAWIQEKEAKILSAKKETELKTKSEKKKQHEAEAKVNEAKAEAIAKKRAKELAAAEAVEVAEPEAAAEPAAQEVVVPEATAEPAAEETAAPQENI